MHDMKNKRVDALYASTSVILFVKFMSCFLDSGALLPYPHRSFARGPRWGKSPRPPHLCSQPLPPVDATETTRMVRYGTTEYSVENLFSYISKSWQKMDWT